MTAAFPRANVHADSPDGLAVPSAPVPPGTAGPPDAAGGDRNGDMEHVRRFIAERDTFARHLGIEITEVARGHARAVMPLDARHRNGVGVAHGGAIFAVADLALAAACNTRGKVGVSLNTAISFLAPGRRGPLTAEARELSAASRVATYEIRITDGEGVLIASCQATAYSRNQPMVGLTAADDLSGVAPDVAPDVTPDVTPDVSVSVFPATPAVDP